MKKQVQGIGFILFGMLLTLIAVVDPWVPGLGGASQWILLLLALVMGIVGLAFLFQRDNSDKR
ncbi:MAG: hypothetical protein HDT35_07225 [Clostridiales bacterium]|nr:hypothetical protein [Clostridiales bacterium]